MTNQLNYLTANCLKQNNKKDRKKENAKREPDNGC